MSGISSLIFDFSRVLIFVKDRTYKGSMNDLYRQIRQTPGYKFFDYFYLNQELLDYLASLKNKFPLYIFTSSLFQEDPAVLPELKTIFTDVLSAERLGLNKSQAESYTRLAKVILNKSPEQLLFIDDQEQNIAAAKAAGLNAIIYRNNHQVKTFLAKI